MSWLFKMAHFGGLSECERSSRIAFGCLDITFNRDSWPLGLAGLRNKSLNCIDMDQLGIRVETASYLNSFTFKVLCARGVI